ncbi:MAG: PaaI family thioesterase [Gemmatimonadaceae bacterium]|nr:PaaI family thioesterase [Gemmatimonadaceae bacterium]
MTTHSTVERRVRAIFDDQPFMTILGATLERVVPGEVEIRLPCRAELTQHTGVMHAGVVTSIVDTACGAAAATVMETERDVVSVEFKINLLAPAVGDYLRAVGRVVRAGRTLTVCSGEVWAVSGDEARVVALMQATMMAVARVQG